MESAFKQALNTHLLDRPASLRRLHDSGAGYEYPDLLSYVLMYRYHSPHEGCDRYETTHLPQPARNRCRRYTENCFLQAELTKFYWTCHQNTSGGNKSSHFLTIRYSQ